MPKALITLDLVLVRTFVAIATLGRFTLAAQRLGRQQSTISLQISRLEAALGIRLLERSPRAVRLTEAGTGFLADAQRLLALNDAAVAQAQEPAMSGLVRLGTPEGIASISPAVRAFADNRRPIILVTCHRRESFGIDLANICRALKRVAAAHPDHQIVFPVHLNPNLRAQVMPSLGDTPNIFLLDPVGYPELIYMLSQAVLVLTDSGGIQEEAPSFGVPVLVLRSETERPEGIAAGVAQLVGADEELIVDRASALLSRARNAEPYAKNPYGDGFASERIADILARSA